MKLKPDHLTVKFKNKDCSLNAEVKTATLGQNVFNATL